jgi:hypothetical protein
VRTATAALIVFLFVASPSWGQTAGRPGPRPRLAVEVGFGGYVNPCPYSFAKAKIVTNFPYLYVGPDPSPSPLFVTVTAPPALAVSGDLVVDVPDLWVPQRFTQSVALRGGESRRIELYPCLTQTAIVSLVSGGKVVASAKAKAAPFPFADPPALVVSSTAYIPPVDVNPGNVKGIFLTYRRQARGGDKAAPGDYVTEKYVPPFASYRIVFYPIAPARLPSNVLALRDFESIAVSLGGLSAMTGPQRDTLARYSRLGGRLLVYDCGALGKVRLGGRQFEYRSLPSTSAFERGEVVFFASIESLRANVRSVEEARLDRVFATATPAPPEATFKMVSPVHADIEFASEPDLRDAFRTDTERHPFSASDLFPPLKDGVPKFPSAADFYHPYWLGHFLYDRFSPFSLPEFVLFSTSTRYRIAGVAQEPGSAKPNPSLPSRVRTRSRWRISSSQSAVVVVFGAAFALLLVVAAFLRRWRPATSTGAAAALAFGAVFVAMANANTPEYILFKTSLLERGGASGDATLSETLYLTAGSAATLTVSVPGRDVLALPPITDVPSPPLEASVVGSDDRSYEVDFSAEQKTRILTVVRAPHAGGRIVMKRTESGGRDFIIVKNLTDSSLENSFLVLDQFIYPLGDMAAGQMVRVNARAGSHFAKKYRVTVPLEPGKFFTDLDPKQQMEKSLQLIRGYVSSLYVSQFGALMDVFGQSPVDLTGSGVGSADEDTSRDFFPRQAGRQVLQAFRNDGVFFDSFRPGKAYLLAFPKRLALPPVLVNGKPAEAEGEFNIVRVELGRE